MPNSRLGRRSDRTSAPSEHDVAMVNRAIAQDGDA
jgi:hypothetical protein